MKQCLCPAGRPSRGPARQPGHFFCFAKRSNQEKATPEMAPRYAGSPRRWHRNREASELASLRQRTLLYPISAPATWRHQRGFTATATATATVAARATALEAPSACRVVGCNNRRALHHRPPGTRQTLHVIGEWCNALRLLHPTQGHGKGATATATATSNGNGRCAERQGQPQLPLRSAPTYQIASARLKSSGVSTSHSAGISRQS